MITKAVANALMVVSCYWIILRFPLQPPFPPGPLGMVDFVAYSMIALWWVYRAPYGIGRVAVIYFRHRCLRDREYLDRHAEALYSGSLWKGRRAVQVIAAACGEPFGRVDCWPVAEYGARNCESLVGAYREWWDNTKSHLVLSDRLRLYVDERQLRTLTSHGR